MNTRKPYAKEEFNILNKEEDHFNDFKSKRIDPSKLQESFVAFANADGGDIWIGIEDQKVDQERLSGFTKNEDANDIIHTLLEKTNPAVENVEVEFIDFGEKGLVLHLTIPKSPKVHYCANGDCFLRINARKDKIKGERITQLGYAKGSLVYEKQPVSIAVVDDYVNKNLLTQYLDRINSNQDHEIFLRKQRLLVQSEGNLKPTVACVLMFDDEPQATLDTRCAIKIYRLLTTDVEYKREQLQAPPITINGNIERQIHDAIKTVKDLLKNSSVATSDGFKKIDFPDKTIHEVLVNAVVHRDYSLNDDIHIRVYDNRIEISSPGKLPGYITTTNIYQERFSRNPNLVRLLHNLPNPVNHDIGEGLDTARNEMKKAGLVDPQISEKENSVIITLQHKKIASLEDIIMNFFEENPSASLSNKMVREISGEDDVNKVKSAFQKLRLLDVIEPLDPKARAFDFVYIKTNKDS